MVSVLPMRVEVRRLVMVAGSDILIIQYIIFKNSSSMSSKSPPYYHLITCLLNICLLNHLPSQSFSCPSHPQLSTVVGLLGCHSTPMQMLACASRVLSNLHVFQS